MSSDVQAAGTTKWMFWAGWIISVLPALMFLMSGTMKLVQPAGFEDDWAKFGYPKDLAVAIGVTELACTVIYLVPRTAVLGAVLLTGYLGGATATHVRVEDPLFFAPVIVGMLVWLGLVFRDPRLRALLPLRNPG